MAEMYAQRDCCSQITKGTCYCKGSERVSDRKTGSWFVWLQMGEPCMGGVVLDTGGACETLRGQARKHTRAGEQCV